MPKKEVVISTEEVISEEVVEVKKPLNVEVKGEQVIDSCHEGKLTFHKGVYTLYNENGQVLEKSEDGKRINKLYKQFTAHARTNRAKLFLHV
jgi:hypothetical protein